MYDYAERDRVLKLRISTDQLTRWQVAAKQRDARRRREGVYYYRPSAGLSGLVRDAVEAIIKAPSRPVATRARSRRRRRAH